MRPVCTSTSYPSDRLTWPERVDKHPSSARVHLRDGLWVTLRAARMVGASPGSGSIAVSIEPTPPLERAALYARVVGLSDREAELLNHLVARAEHFDVRPSAPYG